MQGLRLLKKLEERRIDGLWQKKAIFLEPRQTGHGRNQLKHSVVGVL
jgi:hypothetical protein